MPFPDILRKITSSSTDNSKNNSAPPPRASKHKLSNSADFGFAAERPKSLLLPLHPTSNGSSSDGTTTRIQTPVVCTSRLCKTMEELLHDKDAVTHWLRFMRIQRAEHFLRFWLDAESFKASASSRLCSQNVHQSHSLQSATSLCDNGFNCDTTEATSEVLVTNEHCNNVDVEPTQQSSANSHEQHSKFKQVLSAPDCSTSLVSSVRTINKSNASGDTSRSSGALASHSCGTGSGTPHRSSEVGEIPPILNDICVASSVNSATTDSGPITQDQPSTVTAQTSGVKVQPSQNIPTEAKAQMQSKLKEERANLQLKLLKSIEKDAVSIYSRYISHDAPLPIGVSDDIRSYTISEICSEHGQIDTNCFNKAQQFVLGVLKERYYDPFMCSEFHCQHQINLLTSTKVHLSDIIYNESSMFYFREYMEQESVTYLLQCLLAMDNFQQHLSDNQGKLDSMEAQNDAMIIYDKYFSLQATEPLGFDDDVRFEVECNICREGGPLPDLFATPKTQLLHTIDKLFFSNYLRSDVYMKYLNELVSTVNIAHHTTTQTDVKHKRTESDSCSEHSASGISMGDVNTLLSGAGQVNKGLSKLKLPNDSMRIDMCAFDPDTLWQRPPARAMTLGQVNSVGQYVSALDPEPGDDKRKKGLFGRSSDKMKSQELMALQVAQMVINEVANVTNPSNLDEL